MSDFKDMLKYLRTREGLSQLELSRKLGIAKSTISMYELGRREPDFETLESLCDFFNVDMKFIMGKVGTENDYYINPDTAKAAQEMHDNHDLKVLFDAARDASPDDLKTTYNMLMALKRKEHDFDDDGC